MKKLVKKLLAFLGKEISKNVSASVGSYLSAIKENFESISNTGNIVNNSLNDLNALSKNTDSILNETKTGIDNFFNYYTSAKFNTDWQNRIISYRTLFDGINFVIPEYDIEKFKNDQMPGRNHAVYIADKNYFIPTIISALSLKINNPELAVHIIFVDIPEEIIQGYKDKLPFFDFIPYNLSDEYKKYEQYDNTITASTFIKFDLPQIFSDLDYILYLDSDTLILNNIGHIFNKRDEFNYAAVARDYVGCIRGYDKEFNLNTYFNAGVMFLNLNLLNKVDACTKLLSLQNSLVKDKVKNLFMDQTAFNIFFNNKIELIPIKFNLMAFNNIMFGADMTTIANIDNCSELEIMEAYLNPSIIHYTTLKPWKTFDVLYFKIWWKYYKLIKNNFLDGNMHNLPVQVAIFPGYFK